MFFIIYNNNMCYGTVNVVPSSLKNPLVESTSIVPTTTEVPGTCIFNVVPVLEKYCSEFCESDLPG